MPAIRWSNPCSSQPLMWRRRSRREFGASPRSNRAAEGITTGAFASADIDASQALLALRRDQGKFGCHDRSEKQQRHKSPLHAHSPTPPPFSTICTAVRMPAPCGCALIDVPARCCLVLSVLGYVLFLRSALLRLRTSLVLRQRREVSRYSLASLCCSISIDERSADRDWTESTQCGSASIEIPDPMSARGGG